MALPAMSVSLTPLLVIAPTVVLAALVASIPVDRMLSPVRTLPLVLALALVSAIVSLLGESRRAEREGGCHEQAFCGALHQMLPFSL